MIFGLLCQNSVYFATGLAERIDGLSERVEGGLTLVQQEIRCLRVDMNRNSDNLMVAINNLAASIQQKRQ